MLGSSDERLKRNLLLEGYSARGIPLYSWEYIEGHELIAAAAGARSTVGYGNTSTISSAKYGRYYGTTAQALLGMGEEWAERAVVADENGWYLVDYSQIDVSFGRVQLTGN